MKRYTTKSRKFNRRRSLQGFTLVEVMVVLFIILTIASVGVVAVQNYSARARVRAAEIFVKAMKTPLDTFQLDVGRYPTTDEGLGALQNPPTTLADPSKWGGPYVEDNVSGVDPWGNPYQYVYPGTHSPSRYDLWSMGPDQISGTDDDIGSWQ